MKLSKEKRIIAITALAGMVFTLRIVMFIQQLDELAGAIELKSEVEQPAYLRSRYKPGKVASND